MAEKKDPSDGVNWGEVARLETHPNRIGILEVLAMDGGRTLSPTELAHELHLSTSDACYHVTHLTSGGLLRLAHQQPVRGATEHFYCLAGHSAADLFERLGLPEEAT